MKTNGSNQSHAQDYPANTVRGRICMGLRLDWDKDGTKETSDIYIKVLFVWKIDMGKTDNKQKISSSFLGAFDPIGLKGL